MCGIAGVWSRRAGGEELARLGDIALSMARALTHRGPDDEGLFTGEPGIALAHRRLSIQDLSPSGHQPMVSACGRYVVVFNGEIYNFLELRGELQREGIPFSGHSDTEVLLAAISRWGLRPSLERFNGMFAIALWDKQQRALTLVRDRAGKKPLYYGWVRDQFIFASELKALTRNPSFDNAIDPDALSLYLRLNYVPAPYSIYERIHKLPQGSLLTISADDIAAGRDVHRDALEYWSAYEVARSRMTDPFTGSEEEATERLDELLGDAARMRMISDVPVGVLLSGGIDSSTVTAVAQTRSSRPVRTFSVGFSSHPGSEAAAAKRIAAHLGTAHTEFYVGGDDALDILPLIPGMYDEPFGDSSQIPTYLVAKLARSQVTVALTGDGGDELFLGYRRYLSSRKLWRLNRALPRLVRKPLAGLMTGLGHLAPGESKLLKHASDVRADHAVDFYQSRMTKFIEPDRLVRGSHGPVPGNPSRIRSLGLPDPESEMMLLDFTGFLTDDVLVKVDRAAMAVSLEVRNPLLDHRIVEFAWSLPVGFKYRNGKGKYLLRRVLEKYVPAELTDRPKQGFGAPIRGWLSGPLRDWAEDLLSTERLSRDGMLNAKLVRRLWSDCKRNSRRSHSRLWTLLMFQAWYESVRSGR